MRIKQKPAGVKSPFLDKETIEQLSAQAIDLSAPQPMAQTTQEDLLKKLQKLFKYLEPTDNGLVVKSTIKSPNFVRNLKGWGLSVNKEGDAYFTTVIAGSYVQVFVQASVPTSLHINDLWYKSDDSNKLYKAAIKGATAIAAGQWEIVDLTVEWADVADGASTKPENNATVGATAGTNLEDSDANILDDLDVKNSHIYTAGENIAAGKALCLKNSKSNFRVTEDTYVDSHPNYDDKNYNDATTLFIMTDGGGGQQQEAYLKWDAAAISSLPANIQKAVLRVYHNNWLAGSSEIYVKELASAFVAGTVSWNGTPPMSAKPTKKAHAEDIQTFAAGTISTWVEFDITQLVRQWNQGGTNYGLALIAKTNDIRMGIASDEVAGYEPHIRVIDNDNSDGKVYLAQDGDYNLCRNVIGIAAEAKNISQSIKVYDNPNTIIGKGITSVTAGAEVFVSTVAGNIALDPVNLINIASIGKGKASGDLLFYPQKPMLIEQYPIKAHTPANNLLPSGSFTLRVPKDAMRVVIIFRANSDTGGNFDKGQITVHRIGETIANYSQGANAGTPSVNSEWVGDYIALTFGTTWCFSGHTSGGTLSGSPTFTAYYYSK